MSMLTKETWVGIGTSLAVHGSMLAFGWGSFGLVSPAVTPVRPNQVVDISSVRIQSRVEKPKYVSTIKKEVIEKRRLERAMQKSLSVKKIESTVPSRAAAPKLPRLTPKPTEAPTKVSKAVRGSAELLADPVQGKAFSSYFGFVKQKIHRSVQKNYENGANAQGRVSLYFILNSKGEVEEVAVLDGQSTGDAQAKEIAKQSLLYAAPFARFPGQLANAGRIAFHVTVFFEDF